MSLPPSPLEVEWGATVLANLDWYDSSYQFRQVTGQPRCPMDKHSLLYREYYGITQLYRLARACVPPATRLVGIELNPGPKAKHPGLGVAAIASAIGTAVAAATKKKPKKKKTAKSARVDVDPREERRVSAPTSVGVQLTSKVKHTPFIIAGRTMGPRLSTQITTANPDWYTSAGSQISSSSPNAFCLDLLGVSNTSTDFAAFPATIRGIALSFTQYRFRRLVMTYVPFVSTATVGMVMIGACPEIANPANYVSSNTIGAMEVSMSTPAWATCSVNALKPGGLRNDWIFLDSTSTISSAQLRQECPGSLMFAVLGAASTATIVYGAIFFDYEIELRGLALEASLGATSPDNTTATSSTSCSVQPAHTSVPDGWSLIKNEK